MRRALLPLLFAPAALAAQTQADAALCERVNDSRHPDARAEVQQLTRGDGARATFFAGCLSLMDDRYPAAADAFEQVVKADERSAVAHFFLGRAYGELAEKANVFKQASLARKTKSHFDRAVQLDPEYIDARQGLVEYYWRAPGIVGGSKEKARAHVEEIRRRSAWRGGMLAATLLTREKKGDAAVREWQQLTTQYPDSVGAWATLAVNLARQKRVDEGFATIDRMQKTVPALATVAPFWVGYIAAESGQQLDRGEQALKRYLTQTPKPGEPPLANAHRWLGTIYEKLGQRDAARAEYQAALAIDPKHVGAKDALAKLK
jgi:tetratricopeptide (TPR) repeat protein